MLENPAAYLRHEFSQLYRYNPELSELTKISVPHRPFVEFSSLPVIAATPSGEHAIALYTIDIPRTGFPSSKQQKYSGYGFTDWGSVISVNARVYAELLRASSNDTTFLYRTFLVIGSIPDVTASLKKLTSLRVPAHQ